MGGESKQVAAGQRYTPDVIRERLRRTSVPARPAGEPLHEEQFSFKPPLPVKISIYGCEHLLRVEEFFGKAKDEKEAYVADNGIAASFINGFMTRGMQEEAAQALITTLSLFGREEPFVSMVKTAMEISRFRIGEIASLEFVKKIAFESRVEWKRDALIGVMPAFGSRPILDSFAMFSEIGERTMVSAAHQLVEIGFRLRDADAVILIGETIVALNEKFGKYVTHGYRVGVFGIAKSDAVPDERRVEICRMFSAKTLSFADDTHLMEFSAMFERYLQRDMESIVRLCEISDTVPRQ